MAYELYTALRVAPEASYDEIKRAYYSLVRQHPPEKDPEGFKRIREAYETLSNPGSREPYDDLQKHGPQISELMSAAEDFMGDEDWNGAKRLLKRALVLSPGLDGARNMLGLCHMHLEEWADADKVYNVLTDREPETALYWSNWGHALAGMADAVEAAEQASGKTAGSQVQHTRVAASQKFTKAMQLEPRNAQHHLSLAQVFLDEERFADALRWAESAIRADDSTDFQDFDAFFFMCIVHMRKEDYAAVDRVADRIEAVVPDDDDMKKYVAARFAMMGFELGRRGGFQPAVRFVRAALRFDPSDKDLRELSEAVETGAKIQSEFERIQNDTLVINPLKRLCAYQAYTLTEELPEHEEKGFVEGFFEELVQYPPAAIVSSIDRLRTSYPSSFRAQASMLDDIRNEAQKAGYQQSQPAGGSSGCFVVTAAFGTPLAAEVFILRRYRDRELLTCGGGRLIVRLYYLIGPRVARWMVSRPRVCALMRASVARAVEQLRKSHPELWTCTSTAPVSPEDD